MDNIAVLPPHDRDMEEMVLGGMLVNPDEVWEVASRLEASDFYVEAHRIIYEVLLEMAKEDQTCDFITLAGELRSRGLLEDVGGEAYLIGLLNASTMGINTPGYARLIRTHALRRRALAAGTKIANLALDETVATAELVSQSQAAILTLHDEQKEKHSRPIRDLASSYMAHIENLAENGPMYIPTGFVDLDRILGGLNKSDLVIVAGRPSMGKTALQLAILLHAAEVEKKRVAMFSLEMPGEQLFQRLVSVKSGIDSQRLKRGHLAGEEWEIFYKTVGALSEADILVDDLPAITPGQLRAKLHRMTMQNGPIDIVAVDYLQLMHADGNHGNRNGEISEISRELKNIAREFDTVLVAASQLSRKCEERQNKRPMLSDLRDSGSIEQDADIVMFIYRDEVYKPDTTERPNIAEINVAKQRNGPTGTIDLFWQAKLATFRNLQRQEIDFGIKKKAKSNGHQNGNGQHGQPMPLQAHLSVPD